VLCAASGIAAAQDPTPTNPPPATTPEPAPPPPKPDVSASDLKPTTRVVEQAGVGSPVAFGTAGVLQLGGSAGLQAGDISTSISVTPQFGWFIFNNFEVSAFLDVSHTSTDMGPDVTDFSVIAEPSYHYPFMDTLFGFVGLGLGASWETDIGSGLIAVPRAGAEFLIGRSGILTPSISWVASTRDEANQSNAFRLNMGYSVMW
jgi:hypothetical protein